MRKSNPTTTELTNQKQDLLDITADRLVTQAHAEHEPIKKGRALLFRRRRADQLSPFIRVEKNLASLGFFSPASKKTRSSKSKTIRFTKTIDNKRVEASVTIVPAAMYGLPATSDQDRFLALQKLISDQKREEGTVKNPIRFNTSQLNYLLGISDHGKFYRETEEWLHRMTATTIVSKGVVYLSKKKVRASDTFHVFDRAVYMGQEMPNGQTADQNYVWLSSWQLENINNNHVFPLDLKTYTSLQNHISRGLIPLLQVWLFASVRQGRFAKRYEEVCEILGIKQRPSLSLIKRQLTPSLDELVAKGYLSRWALEETTERKRYKVVFYHGPKFFRDRHGVKAAEDTGPVKEVAGSSQPLDILDAEPQFLSDLVERGVTERKARAVLSNILADQDVKGQLEWIDHLINQDPGKVKNVPGFYVSMIQDNISPPVSFETSAQRRLRDDAAQSRDNERAEQARRKLDYETYLKTETQSYIASLDPAEYERRLTAATESLKKNHLAETLWPADVLRKVAETALVKDLQKELSLMSFGAFCDSDSQKAATSARLE